MPPSDALAAQRRGGSGEGWRRSPSSQSDTETSIVASSLFKLLPVFSLGGCEHPCQGDGCWWRPPPWRRWMSRKHRLRLSEKVQQVWMGLYNSTDGMREGKNKHDSFFSESWDSCWCKYLTWIKSFQEEQFDLDAWVLIWPQFKGGFPFFLVHIHPFSLKSKDNDNSFKKFDCPLKSAVLLWWPLLRRA